MNRMLIISILILGFFRSFTQTNERQYIFNQLEKIYSQEVDEKFERFTPTRDEIKIADSLIQFHVTEKAREYSWAEKISNYSSYYRQYVGYINGKGEKILFINGFCKWESNWRSEIISYRGGGSCFFTIKANVDKKLTYDLKVNAPK